MPENVKEIVSEANGRVNLIGEHTDYNGGWVLPTAIPQKTVVHLAPRSDDRVVAQSTHNDCPKEEYRLGEEKPLDSWVDYIMGATLLARKAGQTLRGFDIHVDSTVPTGSGLSSSAALEIAVLKGLRQMYGWTLDDVALAKMGQAIENEFVGARVGIMDQMACAVARFGEAMFLDTHKMTYERLPLPIDKMDLIVINSGVVHKNAGGGGYNQRRSECEAACATLGVQSLREISLADLDRLQGVELKRARHVVMENQRVHETVAAFKAGDLKEVGRLFYESHQSMRDDYEVSVSEIDLLVNLCRERADVYGARLTGGGFGGSMVAIARKGRGLEVAKAVVESYHSQVKARATILVPAT